MIRTSRRQLARYGADQLLAGIPANTIARHLGAVLVESKKTNQAELLLSDIAWELERRGKVSNVDITTATPLTDQLRRELSAFIKKSVSVEGTALHELIDKEVIGGIRIDTASRSWDKTIARELTEIREAF
ncbi:MAG: atpH [Candidatus Saccharibacteria bacterium]|nr:atpH [Candidatus Saccharibacteria bacterium]